MTIPRALRSKQLEFIRSNTIMVEYTRRLVKAGRRQSEAEGLLCDRLKLHLSKLRLQLKTRGALKACLPAGPGRALDGTMDGSLAGECSPPQVSRRPQLPVQPACTPSHDPPGTVRPTTCVVLRPCRPWTRQEGAANAAAQGRSHPGCVPAAWDVGSLPPAACVANWHVWPCNTCWPHTTNQCHLLNLCCSPAAAAAALSPGDCSLSPPSCPQGSAAVWSQAEMPIRWRPGKHTAHWPASAEHPVPQGRWGCPGGSASLHHAAQPERAQCGCKPLASGEPCGPLQTPRKRGGGGRGGEVGAGEGRSGRAGRRGWGGAASAGF